MTEERAWQVTMELTKIRLQRGAEIKRLITQYKEALNVNPSTEEMQEQLEKYERERNHAAIANTKRVQTEIEKNRIKQK